MKTGIVHCPPVSLMKEMTRKMLKVTPIVKEPDIEVKVVVNSEEMKPKATIISAFNNYIKNIEIVQEGSEGKDDPYGEYPYSLR